MSSSSSLPSVLVCGGGNAAQVCACLFGETRKVMALSLYADEADRWNKAVQEAGGMECTLFPDRPKQRRVVKAKPALITKDPACVKDCDIVVFTVPSSFHEQYFTALSPHVSDGTIVAVMPARSGCDFLFRKVMGSKTSRLGLVALETLPWACRFADQYKTCTVLGTKETVSAAVLPPDGRTTTEVLAMVQSLLGPQPNIIECPNIMSISLGNPGQVVHPGIMYSRWKDWDGKPLEKKLLFYHGACLECAEVLGGMSNEIQAICKKIKALVPNFDTSQVKSIYEWYVVSYAPTCADTSSLHRAMVTNIAYKGLCHPMTGSEATGYMPDFTFRYLSEDVPTGLCFTKGIAELVEVSTPTIDKVVRWSQEKLDKEFLTIEGKMQGKDVRYTRAPQAYNVQTKEELLVYLRREASGGKTSRLPAVIAVSVAVAITAVALIALSRRKGSASVPLTVESFLPAPPGRTSFRLFS